MDNRNVPKESVVEKTKCVCMCVCVCAEHAAVTSGGYSYR